MDLISAMIQQPVNHHIHQDKVPSIEIRVGPPTVNKPAGESPAKTIKARVDFSIDAILSTSRTSSSSVSPPAVSVGPSEICYPTGAFQSKLPRVINDPAKDPELSWVYCTRYRPPKLPRVKKEVNSCRARYRNPRIPFSTSEVSALERKFVQSPYLGSNDVNELATSLNMSPKRVKIWFQNRRARERREREVQ